MKIKLMNKTEYERSKRLWLECFPEDDAAFADLYYSARSKPEYALGAFEEGDNEPVSMLHMIPMRMRFCGGIKDICFVAGVCTRPDLRRMGLCAALFDKAFGIMRERGFDATVLQPFDTAFYERFGYRTFIWHKSISISAERLNDVVRPHDYAAQDPAALSALYDDCMRAYDGASMRGEAYFGAFIDEYSAPDARLVFTENGCCAGYADGDTFRASELFCRRGTDPLSLLPSGFHEYVFPLPLLEAAPVGSAVSVEAFSMIKKLKPDIFIDPCRAYGFDRY